MNVAHCGCLLDPNRHKKNSRKVYELEENDTPGYLPKQYWNHPKGHKMVVSQFRYEVKPMKDLTRAVDLVECFRKQIGNHIEWKIQCFFTQLLLAQGSGLKFSHDSAFFQAGIRKGPKRIKNITINKPVEAHIATLPTLMAVSIKDYEVAFIEGKEVTPTVFGEGSYVGRVFSAAVSILPRCVNDADSHFEFKKKMNDPIRGSFRNACITLLDFSSANKLTPQKGIKSFLTRAKRFIDTSIADSAKDYMKRIFEIYKNVVEKYLEVIKEEQTFRKLTFTVKGESPSITGIMMQEIAVQKQIDVLAKSIGVVEAKIVLLSLLSSKKSKIFEKKIQALSITGWKHLETCLANQGFRRECLDFLRRKTVQQLKQDEPTSEIVSDAVGKNVQNKENILHHALATLSRELFKSSPSGIALRKFLLKNDAWIEKQLYGHYALRNRVHAAKQNPEVKKQVLWIAHMLSN